MRTHNIYTLSLRIQVVGDAIKAFVTGNWYYIIVGVGQAVSVRLLSLYLTPELRVHRVERKGR